MSGHRISKTKSSPELLGRSLLSIVSTENLNDCELLDFPRTIFRKKKSLNRYRTVWLELNLKPLSLKEYHSFSSTESNKIFFLDSKTVSYTVSDGTIIGEPNTIIIAYASTNSNGKKEKFHYKAKNIETFQLWMRTLRRIIGAQNILNNNVNIGIDIGIFDDPTCVTDIDGNILDVSDDLCILLGYEKSELIGKHNTILMPTIVAAKHDWYMKNSENRKEYREKRFGCPHICSARHKNGSLIKIQITVGQVCTKFGHRFFATINDFNISINNQTNSEYLTDLMEYSYDSSVETDNTNDTNSSDLETYINADYIDSSLFGMINDSMLFIKDALSRANNLSHQMNRVLASNLRLIQDRNELQCTALKLDYESNRLEVVTKIQTKALESLVVFDHSPSKDEDEIPDSLDSNKYHIFSALKKIVRKEVKKTIESPNTFFREESLNSRKIKSAFFVTGASYIYTTLSEPLEYIQMEIDTLDPDILNSVDDKNIQADNVKKAQKFIRIVNQILRAIRISIISFPSIIQETLIFAKTEFEKQNCENICQILTSFLFLRFYIPVIANPDSFGLISSSLNDSNEDGMKMNRIRCWALISRIIQSAANNVPFAHEDPVSQEINSFLKKNNKLIRKFMDEIIN